MNRDSKPRYLLESIIGFISGAVPLFIAFLIGEEKYATKLLSELMASSFLLHYSWILFVIYYVIYKIDRRFTTDWRCFSR